MTSVSSFASDSAVFARRHLEHVRQIPEKLLDVTLQPIMFTLLFAYVFGAAITVDGGTYREYLVPGILMQNLVFGLMGPAVSIATDIREGVVDRFRTLPVSRAAYLNGHIVAEFLAAMLGMTILMLTGLVVGWRIHTDLPHALGGIGLCAAVSMSMIWIGTWLGMLVRSTDAAQGIVFMTVFPLTFLSNAFVPIDGLPPILRAIAAWNPVSAFVASLRQLWGNPPAPIAKPPWPLEHPVAAACAWCALFFALGITLAIHRFRRREG